MRYIIVGGSPFTGFSGTVTFTHLQVIAATDDPKEAKELLDYNYNICGGLVLAIDTETGQEAKWD